MNGKIIKILIPVAAAVAGTAAVLLARNANGKDGKSAEQKKNTSSVNKGKKVKEITDLRSGTYSFMSGYTDAKQAELSLDYDGETTSFDVVEDEFLCYSSDSHVAIMHSEDFSLQIEYAEFYSDEDYDKLRTNLADKYTTYKDVMLKCAEACSYISGDSLCYCVPVAQSYVLIQVIPDKGSDETAQTLQDNSVLKAIIDSIKITVG